MVFHRPGQLAIVLEGNGLVQAYVVWFIAAFVLVAAEIMSGTLYLLVIGVASVAAGVCALAGLTLAAQLGAASVISMAGVAALRVWRRGAPSAGADLAFDAGQPVEVVSPRHDGGLRVAYRGTHWDAQLEGGGAVAKGERLTIVQMRGNTLLVRRPG
jgi:membrane protein implicated in regulation of membrane protease activity